MKVLGIETSCDETGVAIVEGNRILANKVASQIAVHAEFGEATAILVGAVLLGYH